MLGPVVMTWYLTQVPASGSFDGAESSSAHAMPRTNSQATYPRKICAKIVSRHVLGPLPVLVKHQNLRCAPDPRWENSHGEPGAPSGTEDRTNAAWSAGLTLQLRHDLLIGGESPGVVLG